MYRAEALLWVDDDPTFCRMGIARLRKQRFQAHELTDASQLDEFVAAVNPGVILLDIDLGPVDGLSLLRQIRHMDGDRRVILVTGTIRMSVVLDAMRLGADYCFFKDNLDYTQLTDAITSLQFRRAHWCRAALYAADTRKNQLEHACAIELKKRAAGSHESTAVQLLQDFYEAGYILGSQAKELQQAVTTCVPKIGQLALQSGLLDMHSIFMILQEQGTSAIPFGQIAIQLGLLTRTAVDALIETQNRQICEVLIACTKTVGLTPTQTERLSAELDRCFGQPTYC